MKKIFITLVALGAICTGAFAQRNCGTMEYYQHRLQQDPSLAQRMEEEELHIQQWTEEHPVESTQVKMQPKFPSLSGFQPSGNEEADRINYKTAKEEYMKEHPQQKTQSTLTTGDIQEARKERSNNRITSIKK